jgi:Protein kinase domain
MLSSFLPLSYLSPLRSLTGTSRSCNTRQSVEGDPCNSSSGDCDDYQQGRSHTPKPFFSLPGARHSLILVNSGHPAKGLLRDVSPSGPLPVPLISPDNSSLSLSSCSSRTSVSSTQATPMLCGRSLAYSCRFPLNHRLNPCFHQRFRLEEELGAGGYGFVMVASRRADDKGVAVKFIIKDKVPEHAWMEDSRYGRIPTEVLLLTLVDHPYIAKCLDLYEDDVYYYLVNLTSWSNVLLDQHIGRSKSSMGRRGFRKSTSACMQREISTRQSFCPHCPVSLWWIRIRISLDLHHRRWSR